MDKELFGDIHLLKCKLVKIQLEENAEPYCINKVRRVAFPLMPRVEKELKRIEEAGIIERVPGQQNGVHTWYQYRKVMESSGFVSI